MRRQLTTASTPVFMILILVLLTLVTTTSVVDAATTTAALGGGIVINEILIDPNGTTASYDTDSNGSADTADEFVELYNASATTIDISGWQLWDDGQNNWFTFAGTPGSNTTTLAPDAYAVVIADVASGSGQLPSMTDPNSFARDADQGGGTLNNGGDDVVLYDPGADEYVQLRYNGDTADDPPSSYGGFSSTATRVGPIETWGSDEDGKSLTRYPSGDTNVGVHDTVTPGNENASPTALKLRIHTTRSGHTALEHWSLLVPLGLLIALIIWRRQSTLSVT